MRRLGSCFFVLAFLVMFFAQPAPASLDFTDVLFEGDFEFDLFGIYKMCTG